MERVHWIIDKTHKDPVWGNQTQIRKSVPMPSLGLITLYSKASVNAPFSPLSHTCEAGMLGVVLHSAKPRLCVPWLSRHRPPCFRRLYAASCSGTLTNTSNTFRTDTQSIRVQCTGLTWVQDTHSQDTSGKSYSSASVLKQADLQYCTERQKRVKGTVHQK